MASTKIRSPFLATESGIANATTTLFRQAVRKSICAKTIVVTTNIKLERMLLHSRATPWLRISSDVGSHSRHPDP